MIMRGKNGAQIAVALNVSETIISKEIKKIESEWREARFDSLDMYKQKELSHLYFIYQEAINGWERSLKESEKKRQRLKSIQSQALDGGTTNTPTEAQSEVTKEVRAGDPRFLQVARDVRQQIRELLGLHIATEPEDLNKLPKSPIEARKELEQIVASNPKEFELMLNKFQIALPNESVASQ